MKGRARDSRRFVVSLIGLIALAAAALGTGVVRGYGHLPPDIGNPLGYLAVLLLPVVVGVLLLWCRIPRGSKSFAPASWFLTVLVVAFLVCAHTVGLTFGRQITRRPFWRTSQNLRAVKTAIDTYRNETGKYPEWLDALTEIAPGHTVPWLESIPASAFAKGVGPRYALAPDEDSTASLWILWYPGPDGDFDAESGERLIQSLRALVEKGVTSPWVIPRDDPELAWLAGRLYNSSDGTYSGGDIFIWKGARVPNW